MSETAIEIAAPEEVVLTVLTGLRDGKIDEAINSFVDELKFTDHGIGLEFKDKERLSEFFRKRLELYPDSFLQTDRIFVNDDHVIMEWTRHTTVTELFYGGLSQKIKVTVHGASIVKTENGKVTEWADYYDGLTSRSTALAAHFKEWVEL
jgi:hypothetical protein